MCFRTNEVYGCDHLARSFTDPCKQLAKGGCRGTETEQVQIDGLCRECSANRERRNGVHHGQGRRNAVDWGSKPSKSGRRSVQDILSSHSRRR